MKLVVSLLSRWRLGDGDFVAVDGRFLLGQLRGLAKDAIVRVGSDFLSTSFIHHLDHISLVEAEFGLLLKLLPAIGMLFGAGLAL